MLKHKSVQALLAAMTLPEKVGQLNLLNSATSTYADTIRKGAVGGFLIGNRPDVGTWGALLNEVQKIAIKETRLGIPLLFSRDVIHGYRTIFPIPLGLAATFQPAFGEEMGQISANECKRDAVRWTFTPMLDIARDARWGRIAEGCGEDPLLTSAFARTIVEGFQGRNGKSKNGQLKVAACAKHFVGYAAAEGGRDYNSTSISDSALWNAYLPPFQAAIEAGVATVMTSFNELNGTPLTAHQGLVRNTLRQKFGFNGVVVSDWNAVRELINHRVAENASEATLQAIDATIDIDMFSECYIQELAKLVNSKKVALELVDQSVLRVLTLKKRLGLFEKPYSDASESWKTLPQAHRDSARKIAARSIVLLKNNNDILPILPNKNLAKSKPRVVTVVGPLGSNQDIHLGTWSLDGKANDVVSVLEGLKRNAPKGINIVDGGPHSDTAIANALLSDIAVCVVGEHPIRSGETGSVTSVELPAGQREFVLALTRSKIPVILVVCSGRPLALDAEIEAVSAALFCFHLGTEAGNSIADIIFGKQAPSGRLPCTLPRNTGQLPLYYNHPTTGRPARREDKFTSRYCDSAVGPLFPFGFGLTYGELEISQLTLKSTRRARTGKLFAPPLSVSFSIRNRSEHRIDTPVMLFISDLVRSVAPPIKELKWFRTFSIPARSKREISLRVTKEMLAFIKVDSTGPRTVIEPGDFDCSISVGSGTERKFKITMA